MTSLTIGGLLLLGASGARAQDSVVAGTVVAAISLRPVEAAQITIVESGQEARTDALGRFALAHVAGMQVTLNVRRVGYRPLTETVLVGDSKIRLLLREAAVPLDAVVVTGTPGGTEARAIGNAVGTIDVRQVLDRAPVVELQQLLNARVPGVTMLSAQGNVGTGGLTLVRGISSLSLTNEPLLYVDGVRVDNNPRTGPNIRNGRQVARINDLNPEDIDSIEIIKGPAAATIYGTEASRGVIQMFTRQGHEGPPRIGITVKQGGNWFMNPAGRLNKVYSTDPVTGALDSLDLYQQEEAAGRPMFQTGPVQSYGLNVNGGTQVVRYYLATTVARDAGIVSYNWRRRINTQANLRLLPSDKLDVRTSLAFLQNNARLGQSVTPFGLMDQIETGTPASKDTPLRGFSRATPEAVATIDSREGIDRAIGSIRLRHQPWNWFTQRLTVGGDLGDETSFVLFPRQVEGTTCFFEDLCLGNRTVDHRRVIYSTLDYGVSGAAQVTAPVRSVTSLGAQYYRKRITTSNIVCQGFADPGITQCSGAAQSTGSEDQFENKTAGAYVQQQFGWKNRLFLTGAMRADDNSAFGANFNFVTYPKLAATWVASDEPFWKVVPWVNALKLRVAWGAAGQQPDAFAAERTYQPVPGGTVTEQNIGNPNLKPERAQELELGFDAGLWNDRIAIAFTRFGKRTLDAIVARQVAPSVGFPGRQLINLGAVRNWGTEFALDARLVNHRAVTWDLGFLFATNDSRIESLGGLPPLSASNSSASASQEDREGYPLGALFARVIVSTPVDANGKLDLANVRCDGGPENNHQPMPCATAPTVYLGRPTPSWQGSVRATLTLFGKFQLYGLVDFQGGHMLRNSAISNGVGSLFHNARITNDSSDLLVQAYNALNDQGVTFLRGLGVMNGGFAKLREVSLTYTLPGTWASRMRASRGTITVAARNLAILWQAQRKVFGVKVIEPEQRYGDEDTEQSAAVRFALPQNAAVTTTVRLTF